MLVDASASRREAWRVQRVLLLRGHSGTLAQATDALLCRLADRLEGEAAPHEAAY